MKTNYILPIQWLLILVIFISCSDDPEKKEELIPGTFAATVGKEEWFNRALYVRLAGGYLYVISDGYEGEQIAVSWAPFTVGKHKISGNATGGPVEGTLTYSPFQYNPATNPFYSSEYYSSGTQVGEIDITEIDTENKTFSGTFYSKAIRYSPPQKEVSITDGVFYKVKYVEIVQNTSFTAKVNDRDPVSVSPIYGSLSNGSLEFSAQSNTQSFHLKIDLNAVEGSTYTWGWGYNDSPYSVTCVLPDNNYVSKSGTLLVTKHDKAGRRIEGTFNIVAEVWPSGGSPITVTEGAFAINY